MASVGWLQGTAEPCSQDSGTSVFKKGQKNTGERRRENGEGKEVRKIAEKMKAGAVGGEGPP